MSSTSVKHSTVYCFLLLITFFCFSCGPDKNTETNNFNQVKVKQQFVKANQQLVIKESDEMDYYQKSHHMPFIKTNEGIR